MIELGRSKGLTATATAITFREFVDRVHPRFVWYRHALALADVLQDVADGRRKRVLIFEPPRHGKSEAVSRLFAAYWLYRRPDTWVGINSYGAELAYTLSRAAREFYQRAGGPIASDAAAVKHWETGKGGGLWAAGVGGPITGKGWHLGIIDDPIKNAEDAASEVLREKQRDWYQSVFSTREEPNAEGDPDGALVVIQTRWRDDDLAGWLLERETDDDAAPERWHVVSLEAIKEDVPPELPPTCTLEPDWRQPGEALCPERRPIAKLDAIRQRIGNYFFSALYQQRPVPREGAMFQAQWFQLVEAAPARFSVLARYWDKAGAAPGKGDWTVGVLIGRCSENLYWVLDVVRGQWPADERNKVIRQTAEFDRTTHGTVRIYVEQPPGLAKESTEAVIRLLGGFPAFADPVNKDKVERAEPFSAQCRAGNVRMLKAPWNRPYLDVMTAFPHGKHDDDVDASSGAFNKVSARQPLRVY